MVAASRIGTAALFIICLFCVACSRYEMKEDKAGRTIRIDHWTGEVTVIAGDRMIKVKTQEEQDADDKKQAASVAALANPKYWSAVPLPALGGGTATLKTSWRNGTMFYQFSLNPLPKKVEQARARNSYIDSFNLIFYDSAGFKIKEISIHLSSMTADVDTTGKIYALDMDDSEMFSEDDYRHLSTWNLGWQGFGPS